MYNRNLLGLFGMFSLGAVSLAAIPAQAQLASQSSQFTGTVPALCRVADAVNATTAMTYANNTLSGTTNAFSFESNGNVSLQLRKVEVVGAPSAASNYTWAAGLRVNNGAQLAQATKDNASVAVPYANGLTNNDDFQMTLNITNGGAMLAQGNYIAQVTTDCIAP